MVSQLDMHGEGHWGMLSTAEGNFIVVEPAHPKAWAVAETVLHRLQGSDVVCECDGIASCVSGLGGCVAECISSFDPQCLTCISGLATPCCHCVMAAIGASCSYC